MKQTYFLQEAHANRSCQTATNSLLRLFGLCKFLTRTTLLLALSALPLQSIARERTPEETDSIAAATFLVQPQGVHRTAPRTGAKPIAPRRIARSTELTNATMEAFYVYSPANGTPGYAIISTDDRLPEVLAYSPDGIFPLEDMPPAMRSQLQVYSDLLAAMPAGAPAYAASLKAVTLRDIEPLLGDIAYGQRFPFNYYCPTISGQSTLTGCVATAAAQLCSYYTYPAQMQGEAISYTSESNSLSVYWDCASTTFDWANILPTYTSYAAPYTATETISTDPLMIVSGLALDETTDRRFQLSNFINVSGSTLDFTASVLVFDESGNFIRPAAVTEGQYSGLGNGYYFNTYYLANVALPGDLADGTYHLVPAVKKTSTSEWHPVMKTADGTLNLSAERVEAYIEAVKHGNTFTMDGKEYYCAYSDTERNAIATLLAACGAMVEMDYGLGASGANAWNFMAGMTGNMGYDKSLALVSKDQYTEDGWDEAVLAELDARRPVYVSGRTSSNNGHAFLIDGASSTGGLPYFHINWGWTGSCNGYFLLSHMEPDGGEEMGDFSYSVNFVTGIMPADGVERGYPFGATDVAAEVSTESSRQYANITITKLENTGVRDFTGKVFAYAENASGSYFLGTFININSLPAHYYYNSLNYKLRIDDAIPEGDYTLRITVKANDSDLERTIVTPTFPTIHIDGSATPMETADIPAGKFYTIYNAARGVYMGSAASGKHPNAATADEAGIYFVTADGKLLSYNTGRFLGAAVGAPCVDKTDAQAFTFGKATGGRYYVYNGSYLALGTESTERLAVPDGSAMLTFQQATSLPLSISPAAQYATLCLPVAISLPDDVTAYKATLAYDGRLRLEEIENATIAANTPIVVYKAGGGTISVTLHDTGDTVSDNNLTGTELGGTTVADGVKAYVLALVAGETGFYRLNDTDRTIASFKAYYVDDTATTPAFLSFDAVTTSLGALPATSLSPTRPVYDLQGRRVAQPQKGGIYIIGGRKVLVQ